MMMQNEDNIIKRFFKNKYGKNGRYFDYRCEKIVDNKIRKAIKTHNNNRIINNKDILCYAPHSNIYFFGAGKIGSCVCKRTQLYGQYPDTSIHDAWFGNKREQVKNIDVFDSKSRCFTCQTQIKEKDFLNNLAKDYDQWSEEKKYPQSADFELSNNCNLKCIMCTKEFSSKLCTNKNDGNLDELVYNDTFLEELKEFIPYLKKALFIGGEPFLIPIHYKIWNLFIELNPDCKLIVTTNGTILNEKVKSILNKGNFQILVSIDSLNKSNYEKIRIGADYDNTIQNLNYFMEYSKIHNRQLGIFTCFMKQNWDEVPEIVNYCNENNISITFNRVWYPPTCSLWNSSSELLNRIISSYKKVKLSANTEIEKLNFKSFKSLINQAEHWEKNALVTEKRALILKVKDIEELKNLLNNKINSFVNLHKMDKNEEMLIYSEINSMISKFETNELKKKVIIGIISTPMDLIFTAINFAGGIDLVVNYEIY